MKRILVPLVVAAGLLGPPAYAATSEESIVSELREQGFTRVEIRRTLLGRTRIVATSPTYEREIVLNPASGVILRDYWKVRGSAGNDGPSSLVGRPNLRDGGNRSASDNSGRGSSGSGRDDADDDDDDNSGSGSSGSGNDSDDNDDDDSDSSGSSSDDSDNDSSGDDDSDDNDSGGDDSDDDDDGDSGSDSDDDDDDD
jgi:hypothetical protein